MAVAIYVRVSTEEQRERQSIATQKEFGARYGHLHQLAVYECYADDGVSGTVLLEQRPAGRRILEDARAGKFDQLLVFKLDRLGRETRLILNAVAELEKYGVRVRSMTEEFDTATATGRLMLTMLSGFAAHEREMIRERSVAGTNRVAEAGAWLGGIVPYGYRKEGERREAHLVLSGEPIPGQQMSEVEVIQLIFRMAAVERKSCFKIADHLNQLRIPCAYIRDDRLMLRGKRKERTSGLWRPGRVRNLLVSTTYMGHHEYGKRSKNPGRQIIARKVPSIVAEETWRRAQQALKANFLFGKRNACRQYLLRALIKCGLCQLTYVGVAANRSNGKTEFYYRCNGKHGALGLYGKQGKPCPSKSIRGDYLEQLIWAEVEGFVRNPAELLQHLRERATSESRASGSSRAQLIRLENALRQKVSERDKVVGLFRRGRIGSDALDKQLDEIASEETSLRLQIDDLAAKLRGIEAGDKNLASTEALLQELGRRLDEPISWDIKRQLIEIFVRGIRVDTIESSGKKVNTVTVTYRFASSIDTCTGTRADINCTLERVYRPASQSSRSRSR